MIVLMAIGKTRRISKRLVVLMVELATTLEEPKGRHLLNLNLPLLMVEQEAKERERVILKAMLNLNMKPLRVVRECVGLYDGKRTKGLGYETVEKDTLLPLAIR